MSITDELRNYANHRIDVTRDPLLAIADRIDAEHESACAEAYGNGVMSVPIALDESQWVRLPVDADGEPWHINDEFEIDEGIVHVNGIGDNRLFYIDNDGMQWTRADNKLHHHAPTVEDVLSEMLDAWGELPSNATNEAIVAEYAAKLQLRGYEE